jgi:hypothetical protein
MKGRRQEHPARRISRGGEEGTMRKILALGMVALLALVVAFAAVGCGQKTETSTTGETMTPPAETAPDTSMMMPDTSAMMPDTSMQH